MVRGRAPRAVPIAPTQVGSLRLYNQITRKALRAAMAGGKESVFSSDTKVSSVSQSLERHLPEVRRPANRLSAHPHVCVRHTHGRREAFTRRIAFTTTAIGSGGPMKGPRSSLERLMSHHFSFFSVQQIHFETPMWWEPTQIGIGPWPVFWVGL